MSVSVTEQANPVNHIRGLAFVRLADGLDSGHGQLVRGLCLELFPVSLRIVAEVRNVSIARKLLEPVHKVDLLEQVLDRRVDLHWQTMN